MLYRVNKGVNAIVIEKRMAMQYLKVSEIIPLDYFTEIKTTKDIVFNNYELIDFQIN